MRILITCPPMLGRIQEFKSIFSEKSIEIVCPKLIQTLSVKQLKNLLPNCDGWIIGDDPATYEVFEAGKAGRLRAAIKWGVGVDNVDFSAAQTLGIPIKNTPRMFGAEVADVAMGYVIGLARQTFVIDRAVRRGRWIKPAGISLAGKTAGLVGLGDIGQNTAKRLLVAGMRVIAYDPYLSLESDLIVEHACWPQRLEELDFIIFTCALTSETYHMLNRDSLNVIKPGVKIVNVARGALIDEDALSDALCSGKVSSAALDVFEVEPLLGESRLRHFEQCIFGTHNASNTVDAVRRTSYRAIADLFHLLGVM